VCVDQLPVIGVRLLDGRVGSTLLLQLLGTADEVVFEPGYPEGERRYLSYCLRIAEWVATPWDARTHLGVTELLFGPGDLGGPVPFTPSLVDIGRLSHGMLGGMWAAVSDELRRSKPEALFYAEKVVGDAELLYDSPINVRLVDLVRDPRDVFCSIRAFADGGPGFGRRADQTDDQFLEQHIAQQLRRLQVMAATPENIDRVLIRYEDLVADLHGYAARLGSWLGIRLDADQVLAARGSYRHHMTTDTVDESVGRWRQELDPGQASRIWDLLALNSNRSAIRLHDRYGTGARSRNGAELKRFRRGISEARPASSRRITQWHPHAPFTGSPKCLLALGPANWVTWRRVKSPLPITPPSGVLCDRLVARPGRASDLHVPASIAVFSPLHTASGRWQH
jgi:hypothetical protein